MKNYMPIEVLSYLRAVKRIDSHTIQFVGAGMSEVSDFVDFVDFPNPDATP